MSYRTGPNLGPPASCRRDGSRGDGEQAHAGKMPAVPGHIQLPFRALGIILSLFLAITAAAARQPNIVFILMDDLGWTDLGCQGSDFYQTPQIDRLAHDGMRFTQAYAACPVCSPTRASILTGQHPAQLHLTDWLPGRPDRPDQKMNRPVIATHLPAGALTLPGALKTAGYVTAHIGKWHLGGNGSLPQDHGFDVNIAGDQAGTPVNYFAPFRRGDTFMPGLENAVPGEYLTDRLAVDAEKFIRANQEKPFLLYLAHYAPHTPLTAKSNLIAKYTALVKPGARHTNAVYAAMLESMDDSVGRIMQTLDELHLATNTLVLFTSDNGGLAVREGPATPSTSNKPLRAGKGYLYEGGLRVPLIIRWPGNVAAGSQCDSPVSSLDFFPTLLTIAGVKLPTDPGTDGPPSPGYGRAGLSLLPVLQQSTATLPRDPFYWHYPHYANQGGKPGGAIRDGDFKLIEFYESGYLELYDVKMDPSETNNLAGTQPQKANDLAKKLADWRRRVGAQMMTTNTQYVIVPIPAGPDGSVVLHAHDATIHGVNLRYEPAAHKNTLGYWTKPSDWVSWEFSVNHPGRFGVEVLQGCGKGSGGAEVKVSIDERELTFTVQDTGHFQNFVPREIGEVMLEKPGRYTLSVKPHTKPGAAVMDLRQVMLKPRP